MEAFVKRLAKTLRGGEVLALSGPLGAGKTTFTQALGRALGVRERITSPTFTLMHVHGVDVKRSNGRKVGRRRNYPTTIRPDDHSPRLLVHIDAYRLNPRDLVAIGALDYLGAPGTVTVVEWAERVRRVLPPGICWIDFLPGSGGKVRRIHVDMTTRMR
jgi:tRNA threonylcarbamoyladenosine biosynthesis protein TsaE